jgi:hypothetical protein
MTMKAVLRQVLLIILLAASAPAVRAEQPNPLDLVVTDCLQLTSAWKTISLSDALGQLGGCVQGGYVLFGLEEVLRGGKEPTLRAAELKIKQGMTVGDALRQIIRQLPPYEVEPISGHLVDVFPKGAKRDPNDLMNLRIPAFDASDMDTYTILGRPRDAIPALDAALTPKQEPGKRLLTLYFGGYHSPGPRVTLHLKNVTVREILNAASVASESSFPQSAALGWTYTFDPGRPLISGYRYTWGTLYSLPAGWKYKMRKNERPSTR